ncbi:MAG: hypothetical protein R2856_25760 [Caldilineaceae bacterium]
MTRLDGGKAVGVSSAVVDEVARRAADLNIVAVIVEVDGSRRLRSKHPPHTNP